MKELLLALPAGQETRGRAFGLTPAHMAYRIGPGPKLLGIRLPQALRGGLMLVDCAGFDGAGDPVGCCRQILGECRRRSFRGIVCDFEGPPRGCLPKLVEILDRNCAAQGWALYVPEGCAPHAPHARVLIPSVLTHGTLDRRLRGALERYGGERTALAVGAHFPGKAGGAAPAAGARRVFRPGAVRPLLHLHAGAPGPLCAV